MSSQSLWILPILFQLSLPIASAHAAKKKSAPASDTKSTKEEFRDIGHAFRDGGRAIGHIFKKGAKAVGRAMDGDSGEGAKKKEK